MRSTSFPVLNVDVSGARRSGSGASWLQSALLTLLHDQWEVPTPHSWGTPRTLAFWVCTFHLIDSAPSSPTLFLAASGANV